MNVKVTGMAMITCLGEDNDIIWERLCQGESGIKQVTLFPTEDLRSPYGGQVKTDDNNMGYDRMKVFVKKSILKVLKDANLTIQEVNTLHSMIVIGTSLGHVFENEKGPVSIDDYINEVLKELGLEVPYLCVSSACSSGTDAIAIAGDLIEYKNFDLVICGGVDVLDIYKMKGHSSLRTLAVTQCKPFTSEEEKGTSLGEGAAFVVLESEKTSNARKSKVYARLIASANTTDTVSVTAPDDTGSGAIRMIKQAMERTEYSIDDIAYINAHGSGTATNDKMEAYIYKKYLKNNKPAISSTKGAFGHTLGATGAIEAVVSILAITKKEAPPVSGTKEVAEEWQGANVVLNKAIPLTQSNCITMSVTYGFGGANACLVFCND